MEVRDEVVVDPPEHREREREGANENRERRLQHMDVLLLLSIAPPRRWLGGEVFGDHLAAEPCSPMVDGADTARITQIT